MFANIHIPQFVIIGTLNSSPIPSVAGALAGVAALVLAAIIVVIVIVLAVKR